jgi:hypothetical protein
MSTGTERRFVDIFFGMLLAVAIFSMGMVFSSSHWQQPAKTQISNPPPAENSINLPDKDQGQGQEKAKLSDLALAAFTGLLAFFTLLLAIVTLLLWRAAERSLQLERAYILPEFELVEDPTGLKVTVVLKNVGRTFGIVKSVSARFEEEEALTNPRPVDGYTPILDDDTLEPNEKWRRRPTFQLPTNKPIMYGHIIYEDIFDRKFKNPFVYKVQPSAPEAEKFLFVGNRKDHLEFEMVEGTTLLAKIRRLIPV